MKPLILITNDDGIYAPGLKALHSELRKWARVVVVAPDREQSTCSHSMSLKDPLRLCNMEKDVYSLSGTPADCVYFATHELLKKVPDIVVSGINTGPNLGTDVYYSGTVAGAREGAIAGCTRCVALSLSCSDPFSELGERKLYFDVAADIGSRLLKNIRGAGKELPPGTILNVNVPDAPKSKIKGVEVTFLGKRKYSRQVTGRKDPRRGSYFWIGGKYLGFSKIKGSDCLAVSNGYVSVTPVAMDCTDRDIMETLAADSQGRFAKIL